ncbi:hypothetical protein M5X08_21895 [Paenibacillus apiarius]|uniref:PEP/pyruvate-binding domain-containing protein n=1 Tax=Paenibacillus apiarius TaxID=46240 RepID=UPI0022846625|nr:PEP/pyruvate-binding domain-containing protein [Paenibacillus apiarius]MCY9560360.1 hypothetical protein [Paenibacillus apiarius]
MFHTKASLRWNESLKKDLVLWLDHTVKEDISLVGGKGANLGETFQAGFPIPRAFSVSALAYKRQLAQTVIGSKLDELLRNHAEDPEYQSKQQNNGFWQFQCCRRLRTAFVNIIVKWASNTCGSTFLGNSRGFTESVKYFV